MLTIKELEIIKEEMNNGLMIKDAADKHDIKISNALEVRRQLFNLYGKNEIDFIINNKVLPNNKEKIKNLISESKNVFYRTLKNRILFAKEEDIQKRMNICSICDYFFENKCLKCGCFLTYKVKIQETKCPIEKW